MADKVILEEGAGFRSEPFRLDPFVMPTDDKLAADAAALAEFYLQHWPPDAGVQCVVILTRLGSLRPVCAYSEMPREHLMKILQLAEAEQVHRLQKQLIDGKKGRK